MRPADENQYSARPNLMSSSRRAGNDQSILEMLERDTGRSHRRGGRSRARWYGAGGVLAIGLVGLLAWLTHDSAPPQEAQPIVVAEVASAPARAARPDPAAELMGLNDLDDPPRQHHAAVVDDPLAKQAKPITPVAMLAPLPTPLPSTRVTKGAVVEDDPAAIAVPKRPAAKSSHEAAKIAPARAEPARARAIAKQTPNIAHNSARKPAHSAPRARKAGTPAQPGRGGIDSDVALISAVIQHASARNDNECPDASCAAKTTAQP